MRDTPRYTHGRRTFTFCYSGCGMIVACRTKTGLPADAPHFRTKTGAFRWWKRHHPAPVVEATPSK